uniref:Uncharacterized protein n=1 Tax=Anguilla anguilla TaxID=7936 RepID=A0A0E9VRY6_ANGAN
MILSMLAVK